jgi:hypothetical protein
VLVTALGMVARSTVILAEALRAIRIRVLGRPSGFGERGGQRNVVSARR